MTSPNSFKALPAWLGVLAMISVALLLFWDAAPRMFPPTAHDWLGGLPLVLVAVAYLLYQAFRRTSKAELLKAILLSAAFLLWAANQFWPAARLSTFFNDLAIALFVLDVFLVIVGWPATSPAESFAESFAQNQGQAAASSGRNVPTQ